MPQIRIAIADDHQILVEGLKALFNDQHGFEIVMTASNGKELLARLNGAVVELVLLDLNMPGGHGLDYLPAIREQFPELKIVAFTMYSQPKLVKEAFRKGADGYVLKGLPFVSLVGALKQVMHDTVFLSPGLSVFPGTNGTGADIFSDDFLNMHSLTRREVEVLTLIAQARSNKEIAEELFISDQTVSVHRKNLMRKLNISSSAGFLKFMIDNNLHV